MTKAFWCFALAIVLSVGAASPLEASYAIYVGKHLTVDGSVLLGGSGDEVSSHWLEIIPARDYPPGATVRVGVDETANLPGELFEIPQTRHSYRYISMSYSEYEGFPPPLTNGGLNEHGVAARDVWSDSRPELVAMTPRPQRGLSYSDLSRIVMERARSAREAVEIVGRLIEEHGYATYGGNSHLFADAEEGWVLIDFAGGQGLWVAERLGPDDVRMLYPGYVRAIPPDFQRDPNYMGSDNFISFAVEQGWYDPRSGEPFDVTAIYGTDDVRYPREEMEQELRRAAPITLRGMLDAVRDPRISKDATGYGQVAHLRKDTRADLRTLWVAPTGSVTAPFLPWRVGVESVPPQFGKHRYLTKGEATRFLTPDWQIREATLFAGRLFKRLMYYTCDHSEKFLPEVTEALRAFEQRLIDESASVETTAEVLFEAGQDALARDYLTRTSRERALEALEIGEALLGSIETRTRLLYGLREPRGDLLSELDYALITCRAASER